MAKGTIKWFNATKGFGFLQPDDGKTDVFVHISEVQKSGLNGLVEGERLEFDLIEGRNGRTAAGNLKKA